MCHKIEFKDFKRQMTGVVHCPQESAKIIKYKMRKIDAKCRQRIWTFWLLRARARVAQTLLPTIGLSPNRHSRGSRSGLSGIPTALPLCRGRPMDFQRSPGLSTLCRNAGTVWGVSMADVSFYARTDAGTSVLRLTPGRTTWLKLKDQHCLSDNVNN